MKNMAIYNILIAAKQHDNSLTVDLINKYGLDPTDKTLRNLLKKNNIKIISDENENTSNKEEMDLVKKAQKGDKMAMQILVLVYKPLLTKIACKYLNYYEFNDAFALATLYMVEKAIPTFSVERQTYRLGTYASVVINNAIKDHLMETAPVKFSKHAFAMVYKLKNLANEYGIINDKWSDEFIEKAANDLDITKDKVKEYIGYANYLNMGSVDYIVEGSSDGDSDVNLNVSENTNLLVENAVSTENAVFKKAFFEWFNDLLSSLSDKRKFVLLLSTEDLSMREITHRYNERYDDSLSEYKISNMIKQTMAFCQNAVKAYGVNSSYEVLG